MSQNPEGTVERRNAERSKRSQDRTGLFIVVAGCGLLAVGAYFLLRDPSDLYAPERQHVVDEISRFHEEHGRYPKTREEAQPLVCDTFGVGYYEATDDGFCIELTRSRHFPPGQTTWSYGSKSGTWSCGSETW